MRVRGILIVVVVFAATQVQAETSVHLSGFGQVGESGLVIDTAGFQALAGDLGQLLGHRSLGPATSSGALGFDTGIDLSVSILDEALDHWEQAGNTALSALESIQFTLQKGLPYSMQLSATCTHLVGSELWALGTHLKYAVVEGVSWVPDIAIRAGANTVLGVRNLTLYIGESDITMSKNFGLFGVASIVPYAGYSVQYVQASSNVLGIFVPQSDEPLKFVIPRQHVVSHRGFVGFSMWFAHATIGFEAMLSPDIQSYSLKLGASL